MKIIIETNDDGFNMSFGTTDWDHYEALGMLEMAKHTIHKEIDRLVAKKAEKA